MATEEECKYRGVFLITDHVNGFPNGFPFQTLAYIGEYPQEKWLHCREWIGSAGPNNHCRHIYDSCISGLTQV